MMSVLKSTWLGSGACHAARIPMRATAIIGVVLIAIGLVALVARGITYTSRETLVDIGPLHATADTEKTFPLTPVFGVAAVASGIALLVVGRRKRA